ncbi:MAG: OmpA family protein [Armatimonadetes bacterium]|nr:OmpA family protein [Armatimonadota bacterium]
MTQPQAFRLGRQCRRWNRLFPLALLLLCGALNAAAQPADPDIPQSSVGDSSLRRFRFGVAAGPQFLLFDPLDVYRTGDGCGTFVGDGVRPFGRLYLETPADSLEQFWLTSSLIVRDLSATMSATPVAYPVRKPGGGETQVVKQDRMELGLLSVGARIGLLWEAFPNWRLGAAPAIAWLSSSRQQQTEHIVEPLGYVFSETNGNARPVDGNRVDVNPFQFDFSVWGSVRLPIGERLALQPEFGVTFPLVSFSRDIPWSSIALSASIGITYELLVKRAIPPSFPPTIDPRLPQPPQPPQSPVATGDAPYLRATITARGTDAEGKEYDNPIIEVEEARWSESIPILPYVFFDSGSAVIPERYQMVGDRNAAAAFSADSLIGVTALSLHQQLLNVIGQRLQQSPGVNLSVVGTRSADETANPEQLGRQRALAVRRYLTSVWGIDSARIAYTAAPIPASPSSEETAAGRQENRRAELVFSDESLNAPVVIRRMARVATPPAVFFYPEFVSDSAIAEWIVTVRQGSKVLLRFDGDTATGMMQQRKLWSLSDLRLTRDFTPIIYHLSARDVTGQVAEAEGEFRVTERKKSKEEGETEVREFNIVGFSFNQAELLPRHYLQLQEIARQIAAGAQIQIDGYTDLIGDPDRNSRLATQRADNVRDALNGMILRGSAARPAVIASVGHLPSEHPYNDTLPEGRMLSRMVRLTVSWQRGRE